MAKKKKYDETTNFKKIIMDKLLGLTGWGLLCSRMKGVAWNRLL